MGGIMSRWEAVGVVGSNAQDTQGAQASTLPYPYPVRIAVIWLRFFS